MSSTCRALCCFSWLANASQAGRQVGESEFRVGKLVSSSTVCRRCLASGWSKGRRMSAKFIDLG